MNYLRYFWIFVLALVLAACQKDEEEPVVSTATLELEDVVITPSYRDAAIQGKVVTTATVQELVIEYALDSAFHELRQAQMKKVNPKSDEALYQVTLKDLRDSTLYYIRCRAVNKFSSLVSKAQTFRTKAFHLAVVQTDSIKDITVSSATLHATLLDRGTDEAPQVGFCVADHQGVTMEDICFILPPVENKDSVGFEVLLMELEDNKTYYVRAFAQNVKGVAYGAELSFTTTEILPPTLGDVTIPSLSITYTSATVSAEVKADGGSPVMERGVCYSTSPNPTVEGTKVSGGNGVGAFTCNLNDLIDGKTYYVRAYATNIKGTNYSKETSFTTVAYGMPVVSTSAVTNVSYVSAKAGGNVTSDGGQEVTERGVCYSTSSRPTIMDTKVVAGTSGLGAYSCDLSGLQDGVKYYIRAYATNKVGTSYGDILNFTTSKYGAPTVTTSTPTKISYTSATCGGNVTADGGQEITERGVCYSTHATPTLEDNKITATGKVGSFTCNLTGLTDSTTYYVRAYAINALGTSFGEELSFTTTAYGQPTITTSAATNITYTSATCGGKVTADGGLTVTERGVCYSTNPNPTTSSTKVAAEYGGLGAFTCTLTDLTDGTMYYYRAYATNSKGTVYGDEMNFTTATYGAPVVTTSPVTNISYETAVCGGNVTSDGDMAITARGVCYSMAHNPTTTDNIVTSTGTLGVFTCTLTGLTPGTVYYVRAFATNGKGTSYGEEVSFNTSDYSLPTVTTSAATNISYESATCGGNVTSDGDLSISERGVCYSTTSNPTIENSKVTSTGTLGAFNCSLTELSDGTTYYFRAYATNAKGTAYGTERSFTTIKYKTPTVSTTTPKNITYNTATCGGNVTSDGGAEIIQRGVCYSTWHELPDIDNPEDFYLAAATQGTGSFTCELTELASGFKYYVRAYAINSEGISYGSTLTFTTTTLPLPSVGIYSSDYSYTTATFYGWSTSDSNFPVTERGFCYSSTQQTPDVDNATKVTSSLEYDYHLGENMFSSYVSTLTPGTTYYVRAFATNANGTTYSSQVDNFTTTAYQVPVVSTYSITSITYTTASGGGNITSDKGQTVTERGICYSVAHNPTTADNKVVASNSYSSYSCSMTGLTPGTTYYVRAYATNSEGTGYGNEVSFTTVDYALPTVTTSDASYVSFEAAICGGNITDDGAADIEDRGVCYATHSEPTMMDYTANGGTGTGKFTCPLTDLSPNTTYYYRAYATNAKGTALGAVKSFTTVDYAAATIYYTAKHKLAEKYGDPYYEDGYVSIDAFESALDVHTFDNGVGMIRFTNKITKIGSYSFDNCKALITITLPYSVTTIEYNAFEGCSGLVSFEIPENVSSLSPGHVFNIFEECSSLTAIHVAENNQYFCDVDGVLFSKDKTILYQYPDAKPGDSYTIPSSVKELNDNAFKDCNQLTSVEFPSGLQKIEWGAFRNCKGITYVNIPDNVTYIGSYAFENCSNIQTLILGSGLTGIDGLSFNNCTSLTSITSKAITPPTLYTNWGHPFQSVNKSIPVYVPGSFIGAYKNASGWKDFTNFQAIP